MTTVVAEIVLRLDSSTKELLMFMPRASSDGPPPVDELPLLRISLTDLATRGNTETQLGEIVLKAFETVLRPEEAAKQFTAADRKHALEVTRTRAERGDAVARFVHGSLLIDEAVQLGEIELFDRAHHHFQAAANDGHAPALKVLNDWTQRRAECAERIRRDRKGSD